MRSATAHILAVATIACFAWLGLTSLAIPLGNFDILGLQPAVGHIFLALSAFRLGLYARQLWRARARRSAD